jgi:hypothetical protein
MLNLALAGPRCAGKRAIADLLIELFGYRRYGLEDMARAELAVSKNVSAGAIADDPALYLDDLDALYTSRRAANPLHWCDRLSSVIDAYKHIARPLVVDDIRYLNEAACIADRGFFLVSVQVPDDIRAMRYMERYHRRMPDADDLEAQQIRGVMRLGGLQPPAVSITRIVNWFVLEHVHGTA